MNSPTFNPAKSSARRRDARLLLLNAELGEIRHDSVGSLAAAMSEGDMLVVNDAATMPSSFPGFHERTGRQIELRLAVNLAADPGDVSTWLAVLFGEGDWHDKTEARPNPPCLQEGDRLLLEHGLVACVTGHSEQCSRLIEIAFEGTGDELWGDLYRAGHPVQYSYLEEELQPWDQQTIFAGAPLAVEPPSSGFHLTWDLVFGLQNAGVELVAITHGTGLSTTGDDQLDAVLPLPERSMISDGAAEAINRANQAGRRIYAMGTGVTRALESSAGGNSGVVTAGSFVSLLRILSDYTPKVVDGLITGIHEPGSSHLNLLGSFVPKVLLERGYSEAVSRGYLGHEYGDVSLVVSR